MYNEFYGFREAPFNITPDPRFLFFSDKHREAFNHVLFGIRERKGFIQITGEVGAGKTTVCRAILAELGPTYKTALILNPMITATQLMRTILTELGLEPRKLDRTAYLDILNRFLLEQAAAGNDVVLLIDEAQDLEPELLEQVRLLSNLETDQRKLLQIVLIGQPELREKLDQRGLRQLRQRITVRYHLKPLDRFETERYIHAPPARRGRRRAPDLHAVGDPEGPRLRPGRPAPDQRRLRQGAPVRVRQRHLRAQGARGQPRDPRAGRGSRLSLIDDALKRAQAAGEGEAARPTNRPWTPTPLPDPGIARRRAMVRAAGIAIAAVALAVVGGRCWFFAASSRQAATLSRRERAGVRGAPPRPCAPQVRLATPRRRRRSRRPSSSRSRASRVLRAPPRPRRQPEAEADAVKPAPAPPARPRAARPSPTARRTPAPSRFPAERRSSSAGSSGRRPSPARC